MPSSVPSRASRLKTTDRHANGHGRGACRDSLIVCGIGRILKHDLGRPRVSAGTENDNE
jgi:hypothetical protein